MLPLEGPRPKQRSYLGLSASPGAGSGSASGDYGVFVQFRRPLKHTSWLTHVDPGLAIEPRYGNLRFAGGGDQPWPNVGQKHFTAGDVLPGLHAIPSGVITACVVRGGVFPTPGTSETLLRSWDVITGR